MFGQLVPYQFILQNPELADACQAPQVGYTMVDWLSHLLPALVKNNLSEYDIQCSGKRQFCDTSGTCSSGSECPENPLSHATQVVDENGFVLRFVGICQTNSWTFHRILASGSRGTSGSPDSAKKGEKDGNENSILITNVMSRYSQIVKSSNTRTLLPAHVNLAVV